MAATNNDTRRMHEMYMAGDMDGVSALISSKSVVDLNALDKDGKAMLHKAIYNEMLVKALTKAGADPNVRVRKCGLFGDECTALMFNIQGFIPFLVSRLVNDDKA